MVQGMDALIRQAFVQVDFGIMVMEGRYDLLGPHGEIILPQVWESVIQPDWEVTMVMWPAPDPLSSSRRSNHRHDTLAGGMADLVIDDAPHRSKSKKSKGVVVARDEGKKKSKRASAVIEVPAPPPPPGAAFAHVTSRAHHPDADVLFAAPPPPLPLSSHEFGRTLGAAPPPPPPPIANHGLHRGGELPAGIDIVVGEERRANTKVKAKKKDLPPLAAWIAGSRAKR